MSLIQSYRNHISTHLHFHWEKWVFFIGVFFILFLLYPKISNASGGEDPYVSYTPASGSMTNQDVIATLENTTESGTMVSPEDVNEYVFTGNGEFIFEYENGSGVVEEYVALVDWIDKQPATGSVEYSTTGSTTEDVTATVTGFNEDVTFIQPAGTGLYIFTTTGEFTFIVEDEAGNETELLAEVTRIEEEEQDISCGIDDIEITSPISGDEVGGELPIQREIIDADNCEDLNLDIMLRDHNEQWIRIGTSDIAQGEFIFDSTVLSSTGIYTITGTHLSGDVYEILDGSGTIVETGMYEEDTDYIIYTGEYNGQYTGYATGYKIALFNTECDNGLVQSSCLLEMSDCPAECYWGNENDFITIDNIAPELEEISIEVQGTTYSGTVGLSGVIQRELQASEELYEDINYIINDSSVAGSESLSGDTYTIEVPLLYVENSGAITYEILFTDLAGNTGSLEGVHDLIFDNTIPQLSGITLTGNFASGMTFSWDTDQDIIYTMEILDDNEDSTQTGHTTGYENSHEFEIIALDEDNIYTIIIQGNNRVENTFIWEGELTSQDGEWELLVEDEEVSTGNQQAPESEQENFGSVLKQELQKLQTCKNQLTIDTISREIKGESYDVKIPKFDQNNLKVLVQTFTAILMQNIEESNLSEKQIEELIMRLNNIFVIIKLVRDDDNTCEQNLSNYYIGQFRKIVGDTKIFE